MGPNRTLGRDSIIFYFTTLDLLRIPIPRCRDVDDPYARSLTFMPCFPLAFWLRRIPEVARNSRERTVGRIE
jgi:hypothetical protein